MNSGARIWMSGPEERWRTESSSHLLRRLPVVSYGPHTYTLPPCPILHRHLLTRQYLEQVDKTTRPYLEKAQASAKPYADAAMAKGQELKEYLEVRNTFGCE